LAAELAVAARGYAGSIVISSENFFLFPQPEALRALLTETGVLCGRDPQVVVYVRRQDLAQESWYNQTVKAQGYAGSLAASIELWHRLWDYQVRLEPWAAVFDGNLVVRPYEERQLSGGSVIDDFLGQIGISSAGLSPPTHRVNTRLNPDILEFQRLVNRLPLAVAEKRRFHRALMELTVRTAGSGLFDERALLDPAQRRRIIAAYQAGNDSVAETYLHRKTLFFDEPGDDLGSGAAPAALTTEKLVYILGWCLACGG
jgi:hypothetical protein